MFLLNFCLVEDTELNGRDELLLKVLAFKNKNEPTSE